MAVKTERVTMGLSHRASEINGDFSCKSVFLIPCI